MFILKGEGREGECQGMAGIGGGAHGQERKDELLATYLIPYRAARLGIAIWAVPILNPAGPIPNRADFLSGRNKYIT